MFIELIKLISTLITLQLEMVFLLVRRLLWFLLPSPIKILLQNLQNKLKSTENNIWGGLRFFALQLTFLWIALFLGFCVYFMIYSLVIPRIEQLSKIPFTKSNGAYNVRIFNPEGTFPVCKDTTRILDNKEAINNKVSKDDKIYEQICINPLQRNIKDFRFEKETYKISLQFMIPQLNSDLQLGKFIVNSNFINKQNEILYSHGIGAIIDKDSSYYSINNIMGIVKSGIGINENEVMVEVLLAENFANDLFDLNVINIEVPDLNLTFKSMLIDIQIQLKSWRYLMYNWFWISGIICSLMFSIAFFVSMNITYFGIKNAFKILTKMRNIISSIMSKIQILTQWKLVSWLNLKID